MVSSIRPQELEQILLGKIPLAAALGLQVQAISAKEARLRCPLAPNLNHVGSAFGGSLYSVGALACYALFRVLAHEVQGDGDDLVIQKGEIEYLRPVRADFEAVAKAPDESTLHQFQEILRRKGRGRLLLQAEILCEGQVAAVFRGTYVTGVSRA